MMKKPTDFELNIFHWSIKWVVGPVIVIGLLVSFISMSSDRSRCSSLCVEKGYPGFRYTPAGRYESVARCYCLTKEEAEITNKIPAGTRIF